MSRQTDAESQASASSSRSTGWPCRLLQWAVDSLCHARRDDHDGQSGAVHAPLLLLMRHGEGAKSWHDTGKVPAAADGVLTVRGRNDVVAVGERLTETLVSLEIVQARTPTDRRASQDPGRTTEPPRAPEPAQDPGVVVRFQTPPSGEGHEAEATARVLATILGAAAPAAWPTHQVTGLDGWDSTMSPAPKAIKKAAKELEQGVAKNLPVTILVGHSPQVDRLGEPSTWPATGSRSRRGSRARRTTPYPPWTTSRTRLDGRTERFGAG